MKVILMRKILLALLLMTTPAMASTTIVVDKQTQTMEVDSNGESYTWPVSTARKGYSTPSGSFRPQSLQVMHYSKKYHNSPMPHSIFFNGDVAIHGTPHIGALGHPASHGCVRLHPTNAATLYELVKQDRGDTRIIVK